ncbi:rCG63573 [Rattus norvegicus]|uniref:RCG63573 n=1 Tax=Rattus norvegicus TaxID=10116 RepID=A6IVS8_RAT|nr:rCG63573 [Rattus norvegicus]
MLARFSICGHFPFSCKQPWQGPVCFLSLPWTLPDASGCSLPPLQ